MYDPDRPNSSQRSSQHTKDDYRKEGQRNHLPRNSFTTSIIIGGIGGIIALIVAILIVYTNASLFGQAASDSSKGVEVPYQIAIPLLGWRFLGGGVGLLIAFATGIGAGRFVVKSWPLGLVPGALAGIILYTGTSLVRQYIPGYPDVVTSTTSVGFLPKAGGFTLLFLVWAAIGGLVSLGGTRLTIRKQPYSRSRDKNNSGFK